MRILILVEGKWDKEFFERVVQPLVIKRYHTEASIRTYRNLSKDSVIRFICAFENSGKWALVSDHDKHRTQCLTAKRTAIQSLYRLAHIHSIYVVVREIEDWYSAGITQEVAARVGIEDWSEGMLLDKRFFQSHWKIETDLRREVLQGFSLEKAMQQSPSFAYFLRKFNLVEDQTNNESSPTEE